MAGRAAPIVIPSAARNLQLVVLGAIVALSEGRAQNGVVAGEVVLREGGVPLGFITVSVLAQDKHLLTGESGHFRLLEVPPGDVRLRFRRIGFAPKDTLLVLAAGDTARIRIEMTRLAIRLPEVVVSGRCTNETPFEPKPAFMAELFDQAMQNAQRMTLLAQSKPFVVSWSRSGGLRDPAKGFVPIESSTETRGPLPVEPYRPGRVTRRITYNGRPAWGVFPPELPDFADTAFINNHCFRYAGQTRFENDSVIAVEFEPVPRLAKVNDMAGTLYMRLDGYQLVGLMAHVTQLRGAFRHLSAYTHRTVFREIAPGVPVPAESELMNVFRDGRPSFVQTSRLIEIKWSDPMRTDTIRP
jgi:hypothetical protein